MRWLGFIIVILVLSPGPGCGSNGGNGTLSPPANPSPFDGQWRGDLDGDGVNDCLTISGGLVVAQSTSCTAALIIIRALPLAQQDQSISLVWENRFRNGNQTIETQLDFEATVQGDGSLAGTLQSLQSIDNQGSTPGNASVTIRRVQAATSRTAS